MNIERFCFEAKTVSRWKHIPHKSPLFQYLDLKKGVKLYFMYSHFFLVLDIKLLHLHCL